ncbi:MAG: S-layer homology domain-containing protein [Candidatus Tumulicola sp.]
MQRFASLQAAAFLIATAAVGAGCSSGANSSSTEASASPEASASVEVSAAAGPTASAEAASPGASAMAGQPAPSASVYSVAYTDLNGTFGSQQIQDLAKLGTFGTPVGSFNPTGTITRGDFVRWLVTANNAIWADNPDRIIRPSQNSTSAYPDVPTTHPDFPYIQGMYDAGFSVGFPDKTFKPDDKLTHEQMIAIKESVDRGGVDKYYVTWWQSTTPNWKDKSQINAIFRGAIAEDSGLDRTVVSQWNLPNYAIGNVGRAFGAIAMFRPQEPVARAEAALVLWKIGSHSDHHGPGDAPRSAADALAPPSPTPSP